MKVSFEIDQEIVDELAMYLPWGMKSEIMRSITVQLLEQLKTEGGEVIGSIVSGNFRLEKTNSKI